jgi:hypothetical protein
MGAMHHIILKFVIILKIEKNQIPLKIKDIWARNGSRGMLGKKRQIYDEYRVNST